MKKLRKFFKKLFSKKRKLTSKEKEQLRYKKEQEKKFKEEIKRFEKKIDVLSGYASSRALIHMMWGYIMMAFSGILILLGYLWGL